MNDAVDSVTGLPADTPLTVELPLSTWRVVLTHLARGAYVDVAPIIDALCAQGNPQIAAAQAKMAIPVCPERQPPTNSEVKH